MSFLSNLFGRSKKPLHESLSPSSPPQKPLREPGRGGTTLRKQEETPPQKKAGPELSALEMAERQSWEVKSLPVWKPGDEISGLYRVEDVLEGGMGRVYIAHHKGWNVKLAIKSPNEMMLSDRNNFARVLREANSWTELGLHPNIAYCYYVRSIEEVPHIFVEYVDGGNLRKWIAEGKCIDYRVSLDLAIQFCHGMEHAHSKGMIHRDIKPENVLLTKDGILKITDFGLVRSGAAIETHKGTTGISGKGMTRLGDVMGTEGFMAPEQFTDAAGVDERADIFSFGVCLYEMCCGARPYDISIGPQQEAPDPVRLSRNAKFPPALAEVLRKCVQWERDKRYRSFKEIRGGLAAIYRELYGQESPYAEIELVDLEADGLNNRGLSYFELGRKEDALFCWEQALKLNQTHLEATYNQGLVQWRDAKIADDEVLRRLDSCGKNPTVPSQKLAELKASIHAERLDIISVKDELKEFPGIYEALFKGKPVGEIKLERIMEGHTGIVYSVACTPDGRCAVSSSYDDTLRVWELNSGECVRSYSSPIVVVESKRVSRKIPVKEIVVTPDGRYAVVGNEQYYNTDTSGQLVAEISNYLRVCEIASDGTLHTVLTKISDGLEGFYLTPDGLYAVSRYTGNKIKILELHSGSCVFTLKGATSFMHSAAVTPDSLYAMIGSSSFTPQVWYLRSTKKRWTGSHRCLHELKGHTSSVSSIALAPKGRYAVSGSHDKTLRVWELESGRCHRTLSGHTDKVNSIAITPDNRYVVSGSDDHTLIVWELDSGRRVRTLTGHKDSITSIAISSDGRYAVSGSGDKTIRLWRFCTDVAYRADLIASMSKGFKAIKQEKDNLEKAISKIRKLYEGENHDSAFLELYKIWHDNEFFQNDAIEGLYSRFMKKGRIRAFNFSIQKKFLAGHSEKIYSIAVTPDCRYALSVCNDNTLRVWELSTGQCVHTRHAHANYITSIAITPDCRYAVTSSSDSTLWVWDLVSYSYVHILKCKSNPSFVLTSDSRSAVSVDYDLRVWDLTTGRCVRTIKTNSGHLSLVALTLDNRYAVLGCWNTLRVWELFSGRCIRELKGHTAEISFLVINPDGRRALSGSADKTLRLWEIDSGRCVYTLEGHTDKVNSAAFTPNGMYAVSSSHDNTLRVWEVASGRCVYSLEGHTDIVNSIALTPDGQYAMSASRDSTLRVWELSSGRCMGTLKGHASSVNSVVFTTDGLYAVSCSDDKTLRVWQLIWDMEFPEKVDWDEGVRSYLDVFLRLHKGIWDEEDLKLLLGEIALKRGYAWVGPAGIRKELDKMTEKYNKTYWNP